MHPAVRHLGQKVREARSRLGLSQRQLAKQAGLSNGMLCLIERGAANPSVQSLLGLAEALEIPLAAFFEDPAAPEPTGVDRDSSPTGRRLVVSAGSRPILALEGGVTWNRLTPGAEAGIEFREVHYEPGASSSPRPLTHEGREWALVLEGELTLELGPERLVLRPGDSVVFDSHVPHRTRNNGQAAMRAIWVNFQSRTGATTSQAESLEGRTGR